MYAKGGISQCGKAAFFRKITLQMKIAK